MMISNDFGPPAGPVNEVDMPKAPVYTTLSSAPTLLAKVLLSPSGVAEVGDRLIWILALISEKSPPNGTSGLKSIRVILSLSPTRCAAYTLLSPNQLSQPPSILQF